MNTIIAGSPTSLSKSLDDGAGNQMSVSSITYRIIDENGAVILGTTALSSFTANSSTAEVPIAGALNNLPAGTVRALREVEFTCTLADGSVVILLAAYVVQRVDALVTGENSFQSLSYARMTAYDVPNIIYFEQASEQQLVRALIQAAIGIKQYRFKLDESEWGYRQDLVRGFFVGNLNLLKPSDFVTLPEEFKRALRLAQVAEAEAILTKILTGESAEQKREQGITSESIGEVKQVFGGGGATSIRLKTTISRPALSYLGRYINYSPRIART